MPIYIKADSTWKLVKPIEVKVDSTWRTVKQVYTKNANTWVPSYSQTVTITQQPRETITVTTDDGSTYTDTFTCPYGTKITNITVEADDPDNYVAGSPIYTGFSGVPYTVTANVSITAGAAQNANSLYIAYDTGASNGATYTFYDANGNVISNPAPGTAFKSYRISGTPSSDRYYCVYSLTKFYAPGNGSSWLPSSFGVNLGTSKNFGTGKNNTKLGIAYNNGTDTSSMFYIINQMNTNKVYGYSDWFIPSLGELQAMRNAVPNASIWYTTGAWNTTGLSFLWIWTSSEDDWGSGPYQALMWEGDEDSGHFGTTTDGAKVEHNGSASHILATRAF